MTKSNGKAVPKKEKKMAKKVLKPVRKYPDTAIRLSNFAKSITEKQVREYFHTNFPSFKYSCLKLAVSEETGERVVNIKFKSEDHAKALVDKEFTFLNGKPLCAELIPQKNFEGLFVMKRSAEQKALEKSSEKAKKVSKASLKKPATPAKEDSDSSDDVDVSIDSVLEDEPTPKKGKAKKPSKNLTDLKKGGGIQKKGAQKNKKQGPFVSKANKLKLGASEIMKVQEVPKVKKNKKLK